MRYLRDLPISAKLGLAGLASLFLLGGMLWSFLAGLSQTAGLDQAAASATDLRRRMHEVQFDMSDVRTIVRDLIDAQTPEATDLAAKRAQERIAKARDLLTSVRQANPHADLSEAVDRALAFQQAYDQGLERITALRAQMIKTRQNGFLPLPDKIDAAAVDLRAHLNDIDLPPTAAEAIGGALPDYLAAAATIQSATLRFLATGNRSVRREITRAAAALVAAPPLADNQGVPVPIKEAQFALHGLGVAFADASRRLFDQGVAFDDYVRNDMETGFRNLDDALAAAAIGFSDTAVRVREEAERGRTAMRDRVLMLALGTALLQVVLFIVISRLIARPIAAMTGTIGAMAEGRTDAVIGFAGRRDDIGRMALALERLRAEVGLAYQRKQMIEQIPIGVMMADARGDWKISFMNAEANRIMKSLGPALKVPVDRIVGSSIDIFHAQPAHQRRMLSEPGRLPFRTRLKIGGESLELQASAIRDPRGDYTGVMVTWFVRTEQVRLIEQFDRSVGAVAQVVASAAEEMTAAATAMTGSARDSGERAANVAAASIQAAGNVQSVAASAEELAASVSEISRQVTESAAIAQSAVREAEQTDRCVAGLSDAASKIGDVVRLIGDIAGRTNLLALNATIEAARAGEAGKGFAVVAGEVKTLAAQTARATQEIGEQISAMQEATGQAVAALRNITGTIQRMSEIATAIAGAVEQQGAATQEIARSVQQASIGTREVTDNIGAVTEAMGQTGTEAAHVLDEATKLRTESETLQREVDSFLRAVQQAA